MSNLGKLVKKIKSAAKEEKMSLCERGQDFRERGKLVDCHFKCGGGGEMLSGHKLILAMASPVFEAMLYGPLAEKDDFIEILDVERETFEALLMYIYTDQINLNSVNEACKLWYAAKKYMLPKLVDRCIHFMASNVCPKNACAMYEVAKFFGEEELGKKCMEIICKKTLAVIQENTSFDEIQELSTIMTIVQQEALEINSELDLFTALNRYALKKGLLNAPPPPPPPPPPSPSSPVVELPHHHPLTIHDAVKCIRFLTLPPKLFAEGPAQTSLLSQSEALAILINLCSPKSGYPMPEGFSTDKRKRINQIRIVSIAVHESESEFDDDTDTDIR